jgi:adenylate kinase family enzyme
VTVGFPDIALAGKAGAGKSTAADLLVELGYEKHSFATGVRDAASAIWGDAARQDRDKLQKLGTDVARVIDPDCWCNLLMRRIANERFEVGLAPVPIVVDDLRFPNEYWALKAQGFVVIRVGSELNRRIDRLKANGKWQDERQLTHVSETSLDSVAYDYEIANDGTKEDLYDDLVDVILRERRRR